MWLVDHAPMIPKWAPSGTVRAARIKFLGRINSTKDEIEPPMTRWGLWRAFIPLQSSRGNGPNADSHSEPANVRAFIETDLDEATISSEHVAELIHRCTPAEALVDVIEDVGRVCFSDR